MFKRFVSGLKKLAPKRRAWDNDPIWKFWKTHPNDRHVKKDTIVSVLTPLEKTRYKK